MPISLARTQRGAHWVQCPDCNGWFDPYSDPAVTVPDYFDEKVICINCANLLGLVACADCNEIFDGIDLISCKGIMRCEECAEDAGWALCEGCNFWVAPDDQHLSPGRDTYCCDCFHEHYDYCADCGEVYSHEDMQVYDCELYCNSCIPCDSNGEDFSPAGFENHSGCTTKMGSERCYGLELETNECVAYNDLHGSGAWGAKYDATCNGKELFSDVLDGDEGLNAVAKLVDLADRYDWEIGGNCGYHLHIDMRNEDEDSLFAAAYAYRATQTIWHSLVDRHRRNNTYCHAARWTCGDITRYGGSFNGFINSGTRDRHEWLNLRAYDTHETFEVRLHHASLNEDEICNWIKAHTRFVDWATTLGYDKVREKLEHALPDEQFDMIAREAWQDEELRSYYARKANSSLLVA